MTVVASSHGLIARLRAADEWALRAARSRRWPPPLEGALRRFSALGEHGGLWLALGAGGALLDRRRRTRWRHGVRRVAGAYAANTLLKVVVGRRRPDLPGLPALASTPTRLSFPSAHATTSFAGARAYAELLPAAPLYLVAAAMAASRVALGVHYPSDVVAGAALGTVLGGPRR